MGEITFRKVQIKGNTIRLDQFLKWVGAAGTGGQAKMLIQGSYVSVNGEMETRRGKKLKAGDKVKVKNDPSHTYHIIGDNNDAP
ncbi:MAG: RNA-binding S4 domain-containing protein [Firmicutes bacterium]|jgi:ribosome-associated protein|nr:RNA-binding S4 domain-containing protein [Bacillota bacterium]